MMRILALVIFLAGAAVTAPAIAQDCLKYGPDIVSLKGRLQSKLFPGPPNYESIRKGDRKETAWLVTLPAIICTVQGEPHDALNTAETNVRDVQLVITDDSHWKVLKRLAGRRVTVTGTLFHAHTGHHRTKVLIDVTSIRPQ